MRGLLDITDNRVDGEVVHPAGVRIHDGDDPYLVVAADKGTATFSDTANAISEEYGFWLGDAFASRRLARLRPQGARDHGPRRVGVGEAPLPRGGDRRHGPAVHGGGDRRHVGRRLRQRHALHAADPARVRVRPPARVHRSRRRIPPSSFAERQRLFAIPRSSWADYDASLLRRGRSDRRPVDEERDVVARRRVRRSASPTTLPRRCPPTEVIHRALQAPVDLLWNGGIGTYVKADGEGHTEVGDRANDPVRVNGNQVRARVVGEGGNLGFTQRGRIEYAKQRRAHQHRLHRQLGGRRHLRPRGEHQDPAGPRRAARRAHDGRAQRAAAGVRRRTSWPTCSTTTTCRPRSCPRRWSSASSGSRATRI